ncbi:outer membrane beta-barrel protein [Helicobacter sp. MIT 21-1697]|uniref:outer membrane beta-barrel protein n=1 Tax=Helicobacter sp. MIT 21-1697 TaxID=2993733 RepID=UPI00224B010C|nr:outer membrane beta-barrel protein [Helicobacter sp. MIT 21-1697]MCX2716330.1 outer membrane beta-barrel protein [Helicobacter sp. MIT 21-1697]
MKKILISSALAASLFGIAQAQTSGLFVGVNAGVPITTPSYTGFTGLKENFPTSGFGWALGLDVGYKQALSESYGLKYYISYNYNQSKGSKDNSTPIIGKVNADINQHLITANVDYYFNFTPAFGAYIGIGVGYQQYNPTWKTAAMSISQGAKGGLAVPVNVGLTYNVDNASQILLGAKIPLVAYDYKSNSNPMAQGTATLRTYIVQVGYNYTF